MGSGGYGRGGVSGSWRRRTGQVRPRRRPPDPIPSR